MIIAERVEKVSKAIASLGFNGIVAFLQAGTRI
jgi:hypothetical protein